MTRQSVAKSVYAPCIVHPWKSTEIVQSSRNISILTITDTMLSFNSMNAPPPDISDISDSHPRFVGVVSFLVVYTGQTVVIYDRYRTTICGTRYRQYTLSNYTLSTYYRHKLFAVICFVISPQLPSSSLLGSESWSSSVTSPSSASPSAGCLPFCLSSSSS